MAKNLITTIQVNLVPNPMWRRLHMQFTWILLLKFLPLAYHHSHFLLLNFFHNGLLQGCTFFLQLGCFGLDYLCTCSNSMHLTRSVVLFANQMYTTVQLVQDSSQTDYCISRPLDALLWSYLIIITYHRMFSITINTDNI